ncbi:MAG: hypothetical protein ACLGIC_09625 [Acidimicrobiia bacterium]
MTPVDEVVADLVDAGEAWIWTLPHPDDPESPGDATVTRIGGRKGQRLAARLAITTKRALIDSNKTNLAGVGPWRRAKVGTVMLPFVDPTMPRAWATARSGRVEARWTGSGRLEVGDRKDVTTLATRGITPTSPSDLRDVAGSVVDLGRALVRRAKGDRDALEVERRPRFGTPIAEPLPAFGGWMVATQHRHDSADGPSEAWHVALGGDGEAPPSPGLALVLAAFALVHQPKLSG